MMILSIVGALLGVIVLYLAYVTFAPGIKIPAQPLRGAQPAPAEGDDLQAVAKKEVHFDVDGTCISAWLCLPEGLQSPVPCIVMGNGLGGTKDILLEAYASRYRQAGFAVLAFDYRHFGASGGRPRQLIWIPKQLGDYRAAVEFARGRPEVDPEKIALWGTSLSGGHVIVRAARDHRIACVVAQCPGLDGRASAKAGFERFGIGYGLRMLMHGQRDFFRAWFGLSPHMIPIVGEPGTLALMNTAEAYGFFAHFAPPTFINEACARINIRGDKYRPVKHVEQVRCPVLMQVCEKDDIIPLEVAKQTEKKLGRYGEARYYPIGHFDIYRGEYFEKAVSDQIAFLKKHLL